MSSLAPEMQSAIITAAIKEGINPAYAMAVAQRESAFNQNAHASKTIYGLYQMRGDLRSKYGSGDSNDVGDQTRAFARLTKQNSYDMKQVLGRDPTSDELYTGHHFGATRAARMLKMDPNTPVDQVFTPNEMAQNPHFGRAGTVGALNSIILSDMSQRRQKFGGQMPDFSGEAEGAPEAADLSKFGTLVSGTEGTAAPTASPNPASAAGGGVVAPPAEAPDLSKFGTPLA